MLKSNNVTLIEIADWLHSTCLQAVESCADGLFKNSFYFTANTGGGTFTAIGLVDGMLVNHNGGEYYTTACCDLSIDTMKEILQQVEAELEPMTDEVLDGLEACR